MLIPIIFQFSLFQFQVGGAHPIYSTSPFTQQSKGCGQAGDFISLPHDFLAPDDGGWNATWHLWGDPAKLLVHEFAKLRYGIFDETGFQGDPLYPSFFRHQGMILPTGTTNVPVEGLWVDGDELPGCDPSESEDCFFRPFIKNDKVNCSLGYMHHLPRVTTYCDRKTVGKIMAPTKHNALCQGKTAMEVILGHLDFATRQRATGSRAPASKAPLNIKPTITFVREPEPQYVLVMETSTALDAHGQWKWINKAAQKFIRYDLPLNSNVAIVTFNNDSVVKHPMAEIRNDSVRSRLADSIPDKYHLTKSPVQCLLCGVQKAVHEVRTVIAVNLSEMYPTST